MIINIFAVKDELSKTFMAPTTIKSEEEAKRAFASSVNNIDIWRDNPSDFTLWRIGMFDDETGVVTPKLEMVAGGRSVLNA